MAGTPYRVVDAKVVEKGMKKIVSMVLVLFLSLSFSYTAPIERTVEAGSVGVTFATNNYISYRYFQDSKKTIPIDSAKRLILEEGTAVYVECQVLNESIKPKGFRISEYTATGERLKTIINSKDLSIITIPKNVFSGEISIEPISEYEMRTIALSDTADGVELKGSWAIHGTMCSSPEEAINPLVSYDVSYKYDASSYFLVSAEPEKKVIATSDGNVLFYAENPDTVGFSNMNSAYSVRLKPYTFLSLDSTKNIISILGPDGATIEAKDISLHRFKGGETVTITTKRDYRIDCKGATVTLIKLIEDSRTFTLTIPEDTKDYHLDIFVMAQKTKNVTVDLPDMSKGVEKPDITISLNKLSFTLDELKKKKDIMMTEGDFLYISFEKIPNNQRVFLTVEDENPSKLYVPTEITGKKDFTYTYLEISSIKIDIEEGYRFVEISNNDQRLEVTYVAEGKIITSGQFLPLGTRVYINIKHPNNLKPKGAQISSGAAKGSFVVTNATKLQDFIIQAEEVAGFNFDPSKYSYEHGDIEFYLDGVLISSEKFIENGKKINYKASSVDMGFRLPENSGENSILVNGIYETEELLGKLQFVKIAKAVVHLLQPEYGGTIVYRYQGKTILDDKVEMFVGDKISLEYKNWSSWDPNANVKDYIVTADPSQAIPLSQNVFFERESHKPEILIIFDKSVFEDFALDLSDLEISDNPKVLSYGEPQGKESKKVKNGFDLGKVGTHKPLKITLKKYSLKDVNEAIRITWTQTRKNEKKGESTYFYTRDPDYEFIKSYPEEATDISIKFEVVAAEAFSPKYVDNAMVEVKRATGEFLKTYEDIVEPSSNVIVTIIPQPNYYLTGKGVTNDKYEKTMTYSNYVKNIDSIVSALSVRSYNWLYLVHTDTYGTCSYTLNKEIITSQKIQYKEGDDLTLTFELSAESTAYQIDFWRSRKLGFGRSVSQTKKLDSSYNGKKLARLDFGIYIKGEK